MVQHGQSAEDPQGATGSSEGRVEVLGIGMDWKVRGADTQNGFCFLELTLSPGSGVPLHHHDYAESFYVLSGTVEFELQGGTRPGTRTCSPGDAVSASAGVRHGFRNPGAEPLRLLSVSVPKHEGFFDALAQADREAPFVDLPPDEAMQRVGLIGAQNATWFA